MLHISSLNTNDGNCEKKKNNSNNMKSTFQKLMIYYISLGKKYFNF